MTDLRDDLFPSDPESILDEIERAERQARGKDMADKIMAMSPEDRRALFEHVMPPLFTMPMKMEIERDDHVRDAWKYRFNMPIVRPGGLMRVTSV